MNYSYARWREVNKVPIPDSDKRALCPECQKPRKIKRLFEIFSFWAYSGPGFFCSTKCAVNWGNKVCAEQLSRIIEKYGE
jgi:hypothetical protein